MAGENSIVVICKCGKKLKAPATAVGRKARCPACGETVVITASTAVPAAIGVQPLPVAKPTALPPVPTATRGNDGDDDGGLGAMYELAEQAQAAPSPVQGPRCPSCKSEMEDDAVLCTNCGYDTRTGKALAAASAAAPAKVLPYASPAGAASRPVGGKRGKQPVDLMAPQGQFMVGVAMSAAFALAASVLWIVVAWATGYAIAYIAILIGGAAGAGMQVGQKGHSSAGGAVAAGMTVVAILFAKLVVLELVLAGHGRYVSVFDLNFSRLCIYLFSPFSMLFAVIGMGTAFRTANGSVRL